METEGTTITGADALIRCLSQLGVKRVFGYPGGAALAIFDALVDSDVDFVLVRHEQGAAHMADGYGRATGKPAAVLVTSGPGATNTVTGIYTAFMDSVPMVVLCGQVGRAGYGKDCFQEVDIFGLSMPIVKYSYSVQDPADIPRIVREAVALSQSGRPGPVLIDLPRDVMAARGFVPPNYPDSLGDMGSLGTALAPRIPQQPTAIDSFLQFFSKAKKPLIIAGQGVVISDAAAALMTFAEKWQIPVTTTLLGKGAFPENHDLSLGMLGMHGTAYANKALVGCDLVCSIGSRWDDRINGDPKNFCKGAVKLHIDVDAAEIDKIVKPDCSLVGDAGHILAQLNNAVTTFSGPAPQTEPWKEELQGYKTNFPLSYSSEGGLKAQEVLSKLNDLTKGDVIVTTDVGQHQMWAAQFLKVQNSRCWVTSGGAGSMGFGFPAAVGCQFAHPQKTVVAVVGDGGFQMTMCELATAVRHKLPIKILILDNKYLGMVRQWQDLFYDNRISGSDFCDNPSFVKLAESFGAKAFSITQSGHVSDVLKSALAYNDGPCVIHAEVEKQEGVFPMIPSGQSAEKMILDAPAICATTSTHKGIERTTSVRPIPMPYVNPVDLSGLANVRVWAAKTDDLFMRLAFALSKKMFTLNSYFTQEIEPGRLLVEMTVRGHAAELPRLKKILNRIVRVQQVEIEAVTSDDLVIKALSSSETKISQSENIRITSQSIAEKAGGRTNQRGSLGR